MLGFTPYLHFMGNTEEAMNYYKSILGGEFTIFSRYKDIPGSEKMSPVERMKMIHVSLVLGNGMTLMATDFLQSMERNLVPGNNFHICIHTESEKETERLFNGLAAGGKIEMPLNKTFFTTYFGMCTDKFGVQWMLSYAEPKK